LILKVSIMPTYILDPSGKRELAYYLLYPYKIGSLGQRV
jgi:hypothetical protein